MIPDESSQTLVSVAISGAMALITLERPSHANAYTQAMLADLERGIEQADSDPDVRAIVLTGAGERAFCAGADRHEIATRDWRSVLSLRSAAVFDRIRNSRKVTIAAINGMAVGGGFELAISCDLRVAATHARFWLPEPQFGLIPAAAATRLLPRLVGAFRAKDIILGGAEWSAGDALDAGLLSEIAPPGALMQRVGQWITRIERRDADALFLAKQAIDMSSSGVDTTRFDLLAQALLVCLQADRNKKPA